MSAVDTALVPTPTFGDRRVRLAGPADLLAVARDVARTARRWPGNDRPTGRRWYRAAVTHRFEAWVIAWPVGGSVDLHDHGDAAGAVVVVSGQLVETTVRRTHDGYDLVTSEPLGTNSHVTFGPGHIHDLVNAGPGPALSVHVYSPALHTMTFYDAGRPEDCVPVRTEEYRDGQLVR